MPVPYDITPPIRFGGVEHRGDDLNRPADVAADSLNISPIDMGSEKSARPGYHKIANNSGNNGGFGTFLYNRPGQDKEVLVAGSYLYRKLAGSIDITYSGSGSVVTISLVAAEATNTIVCTIDVDGTEVLDEDLGVGFDEASITTVDNLRSTINGLTDFAATLSTGTPTGAPAAMIYPVWQQVFSSGSYSVELFYLSQVNHPDGATAPFVGAFNNRNATDFENISSLEQDGCIYFADGIDEMQKFDGVDCYRAGAPAAVVSSVAVNTTGSIATGDYIHAATIIQKDAQGNVRQGKLSNEVSTTLPATDSFDVTLENVQPSTGFNTDCAIVAGAQSGVTTITVDDGSGGSHTMQVGQTAYFYDGVSAAYVEREITAVAATTITIDGANVNVADNAVISNNLRIRLYRTVVSGSLFQEVIDIPNNSFAATQVYNDDILDANLGAFYDEAEILGFERGLPPKFKYLATYKGLVVGLCDPDNTVYGYHSDISSPESWPAANQFDVKEDSNEAITGGFENGDNLWISKESSMNVLIGDLFTGQFDIIPISHSVGCVAHATIQRYDLDDENSVVVWLGERSIYASLNGRKPRNIGRALRRVFRTKGLATNLQPKLKRAVATVDTDRDLYLLFIPTEDAVGGAVYATEDSKVYAYEMITQEWFIWDNMNMAGGAVVDDGDLFWTERNYSTFDSNMHYHLHRRHVFGSYLDYVDHHEAIGGFYESGWFHGGSPSVNKDFTSLKVYSNSSVTNGNFSLTAKTRLSFLGDVDHSQSTLDFSGGTGLFGIGPWGGFAWGSSASNAIKLFRLKPKSARAAQVRLEFSAFFNQVILTAWEFEIAQSHENKMKF